MPLPKIATPTYELELPSTGKTIQYRPFLVKEEKLLVIALESDSTKQITTAIKSVIKNCVLTKGVKIEDLPTFDIEYLFLNIRGKSVGEDIEVNIVCPDDEETSVTVNVNLDDIQVIKSDDHTDKIKLYDKIMMQMKYPSLDQFIKNNFDISDKNVMDQSFELIASCVDKIFTEDEVWTTSDCTKKEMNDFLEQMNSSQFKEIEAFFQTMPKLSHTIKVTNPNTKVEIMKAMFPQHSDNIVNELEESSIIFGKVNESLQSIDRTRRRFDDAVLELGELEVENTLTNQQVLEVIQRGELLGRLSQQVRKEATDLGEDSGLVMIQIDSLESGVRNTLDLVLKDHLPAKRFRNINKAVDEIANLTYEELNSIQHLGSVLFMESLDEVSTSKGYRILARLPGLPDNLHDSLIQKFKTLPNLLTASTDKLFEVEGIGRSRAQQLREYFDTLLKNVGFSYINGH